MCCRNKVNASDFKKEGNKRRRTGKKGEKRNSVCARDLKRVTIIIRDPNNFGRRTPLGTEIVKCVAIITLHKLNYINLTRTSFVSSKCPLRLEEISWSRLIDLFSRSTVPIILARDNSRLYAYLLKQSNCSFQLFSAFRLSNVSLSLV